MISPEILIRSVLALGLREAREDRPLIEEIFREVDLLTVGSDLTSELRPSRRFWEFLREHPRISVNTNYPRVNMKRPLVSVVTNHRKENTGNNQQTFGTVGIDSLHIPADNAVLGYDLGDGTRWLAEAEVLGSLAQGGFQIICETHDDVITNMLSELVYWILFWMKLRMEADWGIISPNLGVADIMLDPRFTPPDVFSRMVTLEAIIEQKISARALSDTQDNTEYWHAIHPAIRVFVVKLLDGTEAVLIDQTGRFTPP